MGKVKGRRGGCWPDNGKTGERAIHWGTSLGILCIIWLNQPHFSDSEEFLGQNKKHYYVIFLLSVKVKCEPVLAGLSVASTTFLSLRLRFCFYKKNGTWLIHAVYIICLKCQSFLKEDKNNKNNQQRKANGLSALVKV